MRVRRTAGIVCLALSASACMGHGGGPAAAPGSSSGTQAATLAGVSTQTLEKAMAAAGVATVANETSTRPLVPVTGRTVFVVTSWQAVNMSEEVATQSGIIGSDLNKMLPMPPKTPRFDDVIGGWVSSRVDADSVAAGQLMDSPDWSHPDQIVYPTAVLMMFMSDVLGHVPAPAAVPTASLSTASDASYDVPSVASDGVIETVCGVGNFVENVLDQVFAALTLDPEKVGAWVNGALGGGITGAVASQIASFLASFWNETLALARKTLDEVIARIGAPVIATMTAIIGAIGVFATIRSYLKPWKIDVVGQPATNELGVSSPNTGSLGVTIDKNAEVADWPQPILSCLQQLNFTPPTLGKKDSPAHWTFDQSPDLITPDSTQPALTTALDGDLKTSLSYKTGTESDYLAHHGEARIGTVKASVMIYRPEVQDLRDFVTRFLTKNVVPGPAQQFVQPILQYYVDEATKFIDPLTAVRGQGTLPVTYHVPKPCPVNGGAVPEGTYEANLAAHLDVSFRGRLAGFGGGKTDVAGTIKVVSDGSKVTGTMHLHAASTSHAGPSPLLQFTDSGHGGLVGTISGPANHPRVSGTIAGHDEIGGDSSEHFDVGLALTSVSCSSITGDLVPLFRELTKSVQQYIRIDGKGDWTAPRTD
jgi:hypothetical protein